MWAAPRSSLRRAHSARSTGLRKAIKQEVAKLAEKRVANYSNTFEVTNYNWATFPNITGGWVPISPYDSYISIAQGATQGSRTGNKIRIAKATLDLIFYPGAYSATENPTPMPQMIKVWFVRCKGQSNSSTLDFSKFFQNGASASAPDATLGDMIRYVNRDSFTPLGSRVVKQGVSINTGNGSLVNQQYMANNDYKMNNILKIDVTPYLYKEYDYPDNTNTPTNDMTIMVFEGVNADGSAGVSQDWSHFIQVSLQVQYTDF